MGRARPIGLASNFTQAQDAAAATKARRQLTHRLGHTICQDSLQELNSCTLPVKTCARDELQHTPSQATCQCRQTLILTGPPVMYAKQLLARTWRRHAGKQCWRHRGDGQRRHRLLGLWLRLRLRLWGWRGLRQGYRQRGLGRRGSSSWGCHIGRGLNHTQEDL